MGRFGLAVLGALGLAVAGCGGGGKVSGGPLTVRSGLPVPAPPTIHLSSPAFASGARIPRRYTCAGKDVSPPLRFAKVPAGAKTLALVMIDPDAPGGPFTHWALADMPATTRALGPGSKPKGAIPGRNGFGRTGYGGPCPPAGGAHHYVIELLALPRRLGVTAGFASDVLTRQRPVAAGVLRATFSRG